MITHETPAGRLTLAASDAGLTRCTTRPARVSAVPTEQAQHWLDLARAELDMYFAGRLREFTVPVDLSRVDDGRRRILEGLASVGYGETTSYGKLATQLGLTSGYEGAKQVGGAMASNPVWIIVPCHRVVGANGKLTGYAGGLDMKRQLLDLESHDRAELALW
ncbi:methylated-DNA--[protein]-cysteine S-methyltransferase [Pseudonocardia spinosispora]|uniref:methylated-DNA--[protein]-cysteine S-methyltransferase n=1 Tax=Pseudonocardia spinosispora TaxID=103441 RepID=UPI000427B4D0|nr:methylated-DNA--[protein]-cysteine S-methyltransferase [Pseudonocardia spinosispora]